MTLVARRILTRWDYNRITLGLEWVEKLTQITESPRPRRIRVAIPVPARAREADVQVGAIGILVAVVRARLAFIDALLAHATGFVIWRLVGEPGFASARVSVDGRCFTSAVGVGGAVVARLVVARVDWKREHSTNPSPLTVLALLAGCRRIEIFIVLLARALVANRLIGACCIHRALRFAARALVLFQRALHALARRRRGVGVAGAASTLERLLARDDAIGVDVAVVARLVLAWVFCTNIHSTNVLAHPARRCVPAATSIHRYSRPCIDT